MADRICLECGERITGRVDKIFCTDYCRNTYHNRQNSDQINIIRRINHILRKNRKILHSLNPSGKSKVSRRKLIDQGYNFAYHTHYYTTSKNVVYYFCYDYGFFEMDKETMFLVKDSKGEREK